MIFISCGNPLQDEATSRTILQGASLTGDVPIKWDQNIKTLNVVIDNKFNFENTQAIKAMGANWKTTGSNAPMFEWSENVTAPVYDNLLQYRDNVNGIYIIEKWFNELSPFALGITQFFGVKMNIGTVNEYIKITHADILLNGDYYNFSSDQTPGTYDLPSVVLHEMGHFLGLKHSHDTEAVMFPTIPTGVMRRTLTADDISHLKKNYPISDNSADTKGVRNYIESFRDENVETVQGIFEIFPNGKEKFIIRKLII